MNPRRLIIFNFLWLLAGCMGNTPPNTLSGAASGAGIGPDPGVPVLRRLNRVEYSNSVRDLLKAPAIAPNALPTDTESFGFDNVGAGLTLVPADVASYQNIAETIAAAASTPGSDSYKLLVSCDPNVVGVSTCVNDTLANLAHRAWRRPLTASERADLMTVAGYAGTSDFIAQLKLGVTYILMSPYFLFKVETDPDPNTLQPHPLNPYELATRLSYLLWSSTPDDTLLAAADANALTSDDQIAAQMNRMLADPRAAAFAQNFAGQWLQIRTALEARPSNVVYPNFDPNLLNDMAAETAAFFGAFLSEDLPLGHMLTADFSYLNSRLAAYYHQPDPQSATVTRVTLDTNSRRGLLTQGAFLVATSAPDHGSPVLRGKFVLSQLFCTPPPPPPPNIPPLPSSDTGTTMRQKMNAHVNQAACAACHATMDAIGFAYEGFDGTGAARTVDNGQPVDTTGTLPATQETFTGPFDLADLLAKDARFDRCVVQQLLTYALGRGPTSADSDRIAAWTADFSANNESLRSLLRTIVLSDSFRSRRGGD